MLGCRERTRPWVRRYGAECSRYPWDLRSLSTRLGELLICTFHGLPDLTCMRRVTTPNRLWKSIPSMSLRSAFRSCSHHDQCQDRMPRPSSSTSRSPNGQGKLRHPPTEAVTLYVCRSIKFRMP